MRRRRLERVSVPMSVISSKGMAPVSIRMRFIAFQRTTRSVASKVKVVRTSAMSAKSRKSAAAMRPRTWCCVIERYMIPMAQTPKIHESPTALSSTTSSVGDWLAMCINPAFHYRMESRGKSGDRAGAA